MDIKSTNEGGNRGYEVRTFENGPGISYQQQNADDRHRIDVEAWKGGPGIGYGEENVNNSSTPSLIAESAGSGGVRTEWNAADLNEAVNWLKSHAETIGRMAHGMVDIKDLMGVGGGNTPLGTFHWAKELATKHSALYQSFETGLKTLAESIYDAADVLVQVRDRYQTAENASAESGANIQKAFGDLSKTEHRF